MSEEARRSGILFVIAAPSGTGKSTVARRVLERVPGLEFSVSYTTRAARDGEEDGRHYHFVDRAHFERLRDGGAFLEWAEVFGELYGTGLAATRAVLDRGGDLLLDIDVQGARQVRGGPLEAISIMILPPDYAALASRLAGRGSEGEAQRARRLAQAREEVGHFGTFEYLVVNHDVDESVADVEAIVRAERRRTARCGSIARRILATFPS